MPKWARRTKSLDALLPVLYLRGISPGDFQDALDAIMGRDAPNLSPDRATAEASIAVFVDKSDAKYPKAVECLTRDREALLTFYDFPAEHWDHLRTSKTDFSGFMDCVARLVRYAASACDALLAEKPVIMSPDQSAFV